METLTRKSMLSGIETTKTLDVTQQQYDDWKLNGALIQHAMPDLSASDREYIDALSILVAFSVITVPRIALPTLSLGPRYLPSLFLCIEGSLVSSNPSEFLVSTNQTQFQKPNSAKCEMSLVSPVITVAGT